MAASGEQSFPFEHLFEDGPYGMLVASEKRWLLNANARACALLGYERDELVGCRLDDVADPTDKRWEIALSGQKGAEELALRLLRRDGSVVAARVVLTGRPGNDGDPLGVVFREDPLEAEVGQGEQDADARVGRVLVEKGSDLAALSGVDDAISYLGPAAEGILGYESQELIGVSALDLIHPEDLALATREAQEAARVPGRKSPPLRYRHKDGSWVRIENVTTNPRHDPSAGGGGVCGRDVTRREPVEEALSHSEGRYRAVVEQTKEGVFFADVRTMRILESNAALRHLLGYTAEELTRLTLYDLAAHHPDSVDNNVRRTLQEKRSHISERQYRRKDGTLVDVEVYTGVVPHEGTDVLCVVAHDVTGRKRTEESLRRSLSVLLALREAGQIMGSTLETEEIVTRLLAIMRGVSGLTAAIISVEDELGQPRIWREVGLEGLWRGARFAAQAEEARRAVLDVGGHRLFRLQSPEGSGQLVGLCLPLRMKERIAGVLEAYGPESLAEEAAVEILRSLAAQAASALENARLYGQLAERERRLADLIGQLFTAQEEERRRVSYEVHDGLAQMAAAAHQHLQGFSAFYPPDSEEGRALLSQALELVQRTVGEARRVIANLRPTALDDFGLRTALRIEADRLRREGYQVDYESNLEEDERLPFAVETALFRIAQEALTNVRKHAETRRVRVRLNRLEERARLVVRDWGRGFDPSAPRVGDGPGERVGLNSMQERAALLDGSFLVRSRPGVGTLVTVEVPLAAGGTPSGARPPADARQAGWRGLLAAERAGGS